MSYYVHACMYYGLPHANAQADNRLTPGNTGQIGCVL